MYRKVNNTQSSLGFASTANSAGPVALPLPGPQPRSPAAPQSGAPRSLVPLFSRSLAPLFPFLTPPPHASV